MTEQYELEYHILCYDALWDKGLTKPTDLLPNIQAVPLVCDGLQHVLQGPVRLSVLILCCSRRLTVTREGRHAQADLMTVYTAEL